MIITDQAAQVLAEIDAALAICDKATAGPLVRCNNSDVFTDTDDARRGIAGNHIADCDPSNDKTCEQARNDAAFIASARTVCPKSLRCLKTAIEGLLPLVRELDDIPNSAGHLLTTLITQWNSK